MDNTIFRGALQGGVLAVAAIASIPAASAQPQSLSATELDGITAGADVAVTVNTAGNQVNYEIRVDGVVERKGMCPVGSCNISYINNGTTVMLQL